MDSKILVIIIGTIFASNCVFVQSCEAIPPPSKSNDLVLKSIESARSSLAQYLEGLESDVEKSLQQTINYNEHLLTELNKFIETFIPKLDNSDSKIKKTQELQKKYDSFITEENLLFKYVAESRKQILEKDLEMLPESNKIFDSLEKTFKNYINEASDNSCKINLLNAFDNFEVTRLVPTIMECPSELIYNIPIISPFFSSIQTKNNEKLETIKNDLEGCKNGWTIWFSRCMNKIESSLDDFLKELNKDIEQNKKELNEVIKKQNDKNKKCLKNAASDYKERFDAFEEAFRTKCQ